MSNGKYYVARTRWNLIYANSFILLTLADVQVEDISVVEIDIKYFATVTSNSRLQLRNVYMVSPSIEGGLVSATGLCTVNVSNITISGGSMQTLAAVIAMDGINL